MKEICIGKIVNTHGIKGELRLLSDFELKERVFVKDTVIYIGKKREKEVINSYRHHKIFDMITLKGYTNINEVLKYKGEPVYIDRKDIPLKEGEYLDRDIIGFTVISGNTPRGIIEKIELLKNNKKLILVKKEQKLFYIPYQKEFIKKVDLEKHELEVVEMEGLFDEN